MRQKPIEKKGSKAGRKNARRQAEAEEFPWTRQLDFKVEKEKATWDDGIYDPKTLEEMDYIFSEGPLFDNPSSTETSSDEGKKAAAQHSP